MLTLALIGLVGGLVTGISPCILPVLPVVFFSSVEKGQTKARPYLVIAWRPSPSPGRPAGSGWTPSC